MFVYEVVICGRPGRWFLVGSRLNLLTNEQAIRIYPGTFPTYFHATVRRQEIEEVLTQRVAA